MTIHTERMTVHRRNDYTHTNRMTNTDRMTIHRQNDCTQTEWLYTQTEWLYTETEWLYTQMEWLYTQAEWLYTDGMTIHTDRMTKHWQNDYTHRRNDYTHRQNDDAHRRNDYTHRQNDDAHRQNNDTHRQNNYTQRQNDYTHTWNDYTHREWCLVTTSCFTMEVDAVTHAELLASKNDSIYHVSSYSHCWCTLRKQWSLRLAALTGRWACTGFGCTDCCGSAALVMHRLCLHRLLWIYCPGHAGVSGNKLTDWVTNIVNTTSGLQLARADRGAELQT